LGERVWGIKEGDSNERIDKTIQKTIDFFESVGLSTKLPDYGVSMDTIDTICTRFKKRGYKIG
jgi:NADP-dependent alcohol dehydrogenase